MLEKINKPFNFIIFGASGDLAKIMIFPSLYELALQKRFPKEYTIYGYSRSKMTNQEFRERFAESVKEHVDENKFSLEVLNELLEHVHYHSGHYDEKEDFNRFADALLKAHDGKKVYNLAFFAIPPVVFSQVVEGLSSINEKLGGDVELIIEKPFGEDRETAGKLFKFITNHFAKDKLYLIDHYLGKAPVRSIFPLRYNNTILNLLLKGEAISNIQISAMEMKGVDERIGFFDNVGIIKDMIQSHLLQILALLTMSIPVRQEVHSIRREKGDVLSALRYEDRMCGLVLGQYESYKDQEGVDKDSKTPTFAALRCFIDLTEWYQVPIYIRTGKELSHKHTYIVIEFKKPPYADDTQVEANRLILELYPKEKIQIRLVNDQGKTVPQYSDLISEESLACTGDDCLPPYANLILDAFLGRYMSFLSIDEILASWHFIDELHRCIKENKQHVLPYKKGSEGPREQHELTEIDNNKWYDADR
jgi:glucose-6-phosphate 1-dehydrogenase